MESPLKKILVISWAMPPMLYPRSIQVARILSQLAKSGWDITVVCNNPSDTNRNDPTLSELYDHYYNKISVSALSTNQEDPLMSSWLEPAYQVAITELNTHPYSALITFAQPWVDHLIGLELHKKTGIPWLAHFSDPWVDNPFYAEYDRRIMNRWAALEKAVIQNATKIIFTNSEAASLVMKKYPQSLSVKIFSIPHSFDESLKYLLNNHPQSDVELLKIVFTGDLYGKRNASSLFSAINDLKQTYPLELQVNIKFIGSISQSDKKMVQDFELDHVVDFNDQIPYLENLKTCAQSDVLLLIDAPTDQPSPFLPSKLVDYLLFSKPILGLTPPNGASAVLLQKIGGYIIQPDDINVIKQTILELIKRKKSNTLRVRQDFDRITTEYASGYVVKMFEKILLDVINTDITEADESVHQIQPWNGNMNNIVTLVCPIHKNDLIETEGELICTHGCHFSIIDSIPRFVPIKNYSSSFGLQWNTFRTTQLDSHTGLTISRDRLTRIAGGSLGIFHGKKVLEAGCGAGRFTELLLNAGATVFAADISTAVEANYKNCSQNSSYFVCQADIVSLPVLPEQFDIVLCIGVIQHTPNPEATIEALSKYVKPGGMLLIDHYTHGYPATPSRQWLRSYLLKQSEEYSLNFVKKIVDFLWPIHKFLYVHKNNPLIKWVYPSFIYWSPVVDYHASYSQLGETLLYEWGLLDTHDTLTDHYKHLRSADEINTILSTNGFTKTETTYAGNGVEARAWKPEK